MAQDPDRLPAAVEHAVALLKRYDMPNPEVIARDGRVIDLVIDVKIAPEEIADFTDNEEEEPLEGDFSVESRFEFCRRKGGGWKLRRSLITFKDGDPEHDYTFKLNLSMLEMLRLLGNKQRMRDLKSGVPRSSGPAKNQTLDAKKSTQLRI